MSVTRCESPFSHGLYARARAYCVRCSPEAGSLFYEERKEQGSTSRGGLSMFEIGTGFLGEGPL
jgi:hypothetical protein